MKTACSILVSLCIVCFTSCSKDSLFEVEAVPAYEAQIENNNPNSTIASIARSTKPSTASLNTTIQLQVVSDSESGLQYLIDLTGSQDLSRVEVEDDQYLDFTDESGNNVTLAFEVDSFTGTQGSLDIDFAIGSNDLKDLTLKTTQNIIIQDDVIN